MVLLTAFISSCKTESDIRRVDFNQRVVESGILRDYDNKFMLLDLCKIITVEWDSIYIVPAYVDIKFLKEIKANNIREIKNRIEMQSLSDGAIQIIVIKDKNIVEFGELSVVILDLTTLTDSDGRLKLITKDDCSKFYLNPKPNDGELTKVYMT